MAKALLVDAVMTIVSAGVGNAHPGKTVLIPHRRAQRYGMVRSSRVPTGANPRRMRS
ncbi:hypothetical protein KCP78_15050 [Salmonella enterica subsp. enterica]|nr:hypothetical protein KCP78_15050 [Salmonella enterica subsp. enterica]